MKAKLRLVKLNILNFIMSSLNSMNCFSARTEHGQIFIFQNYFQIPSLLDTKKLSSVLSVSEVEKFSHISLSLSLTNKISHVWPFFHMLLANYFLQLWVLTFKKAFKYFKAFDSSYWIRFTFYHLPITLNFA